MGLYSYTLYQSEPSDPVWYRVRGEHWEKLSTERNPKSLWCRDKPPAGMPSNYETD